MNLTLQSIIERIQQQDPLHAKKLKRNLKNLSSDYEAKCNVFLEKYQNYLSSSNKSLENGVDNYLKMIADFMYEQLRFSETGKYSSTSFEEVNKRVYNNPEVMDYFMNGLLLSQVLWKHHYSIFSFFSQNFPKYKNNIYNYLEIGGGHGLFISEAINVLGNNTKFTLVDISPTSIEVSKKFIGAHPVEYVLSDIFKYETNTKYNFITMGEVIEHVEDPVALLNKLKELLAPNGVIFMTTPTNAPSIDHIYLFRNAQEVIDIIQKAGLEVIEDIKVYAEDLPEEMAIELKVTMMYGCFLKLK
jgi:2-polyprenyl-3-methyl-5-hydroxy-6-metoxy-1,4-benzoquinol methylase